MILPDRGIVETWTGIPEQCQPPRDLVLAMCVLGLGLLYLKLQPLSRWIPRRFRKPPPANSTYHRSTQVCYSPGPHFTYHQRCEWSTVGCSIYGWPSSGGVVVRDDADLVELKFLGFDPLDPPLTRDKDPEKEDRFCLELQKIGGKWWQSQQRRYYRQRGYDRAGMGFDPSKDEDVERFIGWPEGGGMLVAEFEDGGEIPEEIGKLRMMTTMEARCGLLREKFGAKFYREPALYEGFAFLGPPRSETKSDYFNEKCDSAVRS